MLLVADIEQDWIDVNNNCPLTQSMQRELGCRVFDVFRSISTWPWPVPNSLILMNNQVGSKGPASTLDAGVVRRQKSMQRY